MAAVTIGEKTLSVSLPNFVKIEAAWAYIEAAIGNPSPMGSVRAMLGIVAVGTEPDTAEPEDLTAAKLAPKVAQYAKELKAAEIGALREFVNPLLVELGLARPAGEQTPAGEETENPSTATSAPSSSTSSEVSDPPTGAA